MLMGFLLLQLCNCGRVYLASHYLNKRKEISQGSAISIQFVPCKSFEVAVRLGIGETCRTAKVGET